MYADDTNIFISGNNIDEMTNNLNNELKFLSVWFKANRLSLNIDKTHTLIFSLNSNDRKRNVNLKINDCLIETRDKTTFLGITMNNRLGWDDHNYIIYQTQSSKINRHFKESF